MRTSSAIIAAIVGLALVGCGSGCDGERAQKVNSPHAAVSPGASGTPAVATMLGSDGSAQTGPELPRVPGALDAPAGSLDGLFTGLQLAEKNDPGGRVDVVFFGDSHTAGDSMTERIRLGWQAKFGDAGRGLVAAGKPPTRHYYQRDVKYGIDGDWKAAVGGHHGDVEPFGIGGIRVSGSRKGAQLWVETCTECPGDKLVAQFEILYYSAPDHGILKYRVDDGAWQQVATKTAAIEPPHPARVVVPVPEGAHRLTLEHGGGGAIDLFGVVMERQKPGVIVDSLGVVGRRLGSLRSWDWAIIGEQLATRDPRLVVLQYGTNESDDPDLNLDDLARYYDETILRIRAAAPTASILILGPPDTATREAGKQCDRMARSQIPADAGVIPECEWRTPAVLGEIIAVEHAAAIRNHVMFFDTFAAMGGADHMHGWFTAEPRVAYKDHVHFTDIGYQMWADALSASLLDEYARWKRTHEK
jgi:lysophospholipase L1-like esterase